MLDLQPTLTGTLLRVRPLHQEDQDPLYSVASDPLIWAQHPAKERAEPEGFRKFFEESMDSGGALAVIDTATQKIIGSSRYFGYDPTTREVEIGWTFLARSHWGGRYNGELKQLMLHHAFMYVDTVVFLIHDDNRRSQRAVEKIGGVLDPERRSRGMLVYKLRAPRSTS